MSRRLLAAVVAVLLAGLGAVLVFNYVSGAEQRALAGMDPVEVLVVAEPIARGTPGEDLGDLVTIEALPATAVGPGAVSDLGEMAGQVAVTDLHPGEQLLASRFTDPESFAAEAAVEIPEGLHQVSVLLDSQRVLGGNLLPGATVGVFISLTGDEPQTHLALHKVLVTKVQGGITAPPATPEEGAEEPPAAAPMPEGSVMVTFALSPADAEKVVYAAEYESIWLSIENAEVPETGTRIVTRENVYE
ncbi:RcpC/CpaB family pilus assembly protein [Georgenia sp. 10Sc9-8]|uniref:RcpC/CpaB family pilus assembly protein n=1 Tax=Georgenia halotolerans TaxID=3028317 RepID=A0ABT5TU56_9MICO|nr:RcpC/CpaB family pilus assembly protein [Georgenia halotolerans]